jgi:hypothetical protein
VFGGYFFCGFLWLLVKPAEVIDLAICSQGFQKSNV